MADAASDKKGIDIVTMRMRRVSGICDYFVIASGTSTTHVRAISDNIVNKLTEKGQRLRHVEGQREASWILIDFGDVVGHVFLKDTRKFYDLEKLWSHAPRMPVMASRAAVPARSGGKRPRRRPAGRKAGKSPAGRRSGKAARKPLKRARKKNK